MKQTKNIDVIKDKKLTVRLDFFEDCVLLAGLSQIVQHPYPDPPFFVELYAQFLSLECFRIRRKKDACF